MVGLQGEQEAWWQKPILHKGVLGATLTSEDDARPSSEGWMDWKIPAGVLVTPLSG